MKSGFYFIFLTKAHVLKQKEKLSSVEVYIVISISSLYFYDCKKLKIHLRALCPRNALCGSSMNLFKALIMLLTYNSWSASLKKVLKVSINWFPIYSQYCCYDQGGCFAFSHCFAVILCKCAGPKPTQRCSAQPDLPVEKVLVGVLTFTSCDASWAYILQAGRLFSTLWMLAVLGWGAHLRTDLLPLNLFCPVGEDPRFSLASRKSFFFW